MACRQPINELALRTDDDMPPTMWNKACTGPCQEDGEAWDAKDEQLLQTQHRLRTKSVKRFSSGTPRYSRDSGRSFPKELER